MTTLRRQGINPITLYGKNPNGTALNVSFARLWTSKVSDVSRDAPVRHGEGFTLETLDRRMVVTFWSVPESPLAAMVANEEDFIRVYTEFKTASIVSLHGTDHSSGGPANLFIARPQQESIVLRIGQNIATVEKEYFHKGFGHLFPHDELSENPPPLHEIFGTMLKK